MSFGPRVYQYKTSETSRFDPMDEIFPKVAKCVFHKFGPSGSIVRHDALCVLPLNILNQKIFVFLWFWFVIVAILSTIGLLYRAATLSPNFRYMLLRGRSRLTPVENLQTISRHLLIGDWFLLYLMAKNMDPFAFKDFMNELAPKMEKNDHFPEM
ncbi:Structural component of the gap junction [Halocaridina rubra]|uniref:Innexin n=1 Tax=Halocaridina rubra TaxID=373956 RepID=A0AAN8WIX3_HALRR